MHRRYVMQYAPGMMGMVLCDVLTRGVPGKIGRVPPLHRALGRAMPNRPFGPCGPCGQVVPSRVVFKLPPDSYLVFHKDHALLEYEGREPPEYFEGVMRRLHVELGVHACPEWMAPDDFSWLRPPATDGQFVSDVPPCFLTPDELLLRTQLAAGCRCRGAA